ncbi:WD40-repeat-containing domain protein [Xylaria telfairii]|nr:WD40-repeat-containing domain protein [Xylaria telfairii]
MSHEVAPPGRLRREYVLSPITALAFLTLGKKQYLLAAEDTDVRIYDVAASQLRGTLPVFHAQPIHGISVPPSTGEDHGNPVASGNPSRILVWGGHAVKVLPTRLIEDLIFASSTNGNENAFGKSSLVATALSTPETIAPDWIFDGRISPFDDSRVVLLTAHNEVIQGHVSANQTLLLGRVRSPSRPNLYSGNFFWVNQNCVLVAAGTVFGEIVVWKCPLEPNLDIDCCDRGARERGAKERKETPDCEVLFVFSGHEGSIFGVHISHEILTSSGEKIRLLASCSDDRTIRIWDITERSDEPTSDDNGYVAQISDARQTGFGDSIVGSVGLVNSHSRCVAMAMGHVSRIWQVEIRSSGLLARKDMIEVYSFGEDGTMQRWHLELNAELEAMRKTGASNNSSPLPSTLTHHETFSNHSGKQIWSHAMIVNRNGLLIATGGGDGKIALIEHDSGFLSKTLADNTGYCPRSIEELDISPISLIENCQQQNLGAAPSLLTFKHGNGKEMFQSFAFITDDRLLITTRSGRLFLGSFGSTIEWKELAIPDDIRRTIQSYTILRSSRRASTAFIGAPNGELFFYREASGDLIRSIYKAERKIVDIICLTDNLPSSARTDGDAAREGDEYIELLVTVFGSTKAEFLRLDQKYTLIQRTEVRVPDKFIVTSAAWCHNYLILGSRNGSMSVFDLATSEGDTPILTMEVKIGDKITSILPLPRQSEDSPLYFLTTARDGKYRVYEITNTTNLQLHLIHETRPPFGPLIEGSWPVDNLDGKRDLMLYGFRGKYFVAWNATQQTEIAAIDCGGGHRVFDQVPVRGNPEGLRFACTKASQMKIFSQTRAPHRPLKVGGHGREIKAVSVSESGKYVSTGAEDTVIRIWELRDGRGGGEPKLLRCMLALEKHNTGIQKLKWSRDQYLFSSGGNEEFFVWRVTALECDVCSLGVVCEAVFPDRSEVGDLRITDFDVDCLSEDASADDGADGSDVRLDKPRTEPKFCISMTLSNSTVQSYFYSSRQGFQLLGRRTYTGACLTQLRHLNFIDGFQPQVLTAATDGHLAVFTEIQSRGNETEDSNDILVAKLHQSTVKSLDMRSIATATGTSYLVVTGGDDDAIGVVHLHRPAGQASQYEIRHKSIVRSAHAAAVTGLGIVRFENEERDAVVVTASNDQRVKTWRLVGWQTASPRVHLLDDRYSGVADAGDLEVVGGGYADGDESLLDEKNRGRILVAGVGIEAWDVS